MTSPLLDCMLLNIFLCILYIKKYVSPPPPPDTQVSLEIYLSPLTLASIPERALFEIFMELR